MTARQTAGKFDGRMARKLREERNVTVPELADRIEDSTGRRWDDDHLRNVELGHKQPGLKLSHAWADALGVEWGDLMTDASAPAPQ